MLDWVIVAIALTLVAAIILVIISIVEGAILITLCSLLYIIMLCYMLHDELHNN